jgi:hypothetical protein
MSIRILHFNQFGGQISQSENFSNFFGKSVKVDISFIFGRPLGAGFGAGTCPTKQKEIINDKQFTFINLAAPLGAGWGAGLAQLSNRKFSTVNDSLQPICHPLGAGWWAGTCPTEQQDILDNKRFISINLAAPKGRVLGWGGSQLETSESITKNFSLRPIWPPDRSK